MAKTYTYDCELVCQRTTTAWNSGYVVIDMDDYRTGRTSSALWWRIRIYPEDFSTTNMTKATLKLTVADAGLSSTTVKHGVYEAYSTQGYSDANGVVYHSIQFSSLTAGDTISIDITALVENGVTGFVFQCSDEPSYTTCWVQYSKAELLITTSETDYVLSYNANDGSGAPASQTVTGVGSATFTVSSTTPTRTGYNFLGWATTSTATSATYAAGDSIIISKSTTLYAVWQIKTYTVSYKKGTTGTGTNTTATKTYGVTLTLKGAIFTRTGYTQTGWATSDGGSKAYNLSGSYTANKAVTLYPVWTANTYTVTFDANCGTVSQTSLQVTYDQAYGELPTPTRPGYKFDGWFTKASGGTQIESATTVNITTTQTLYAHWTVQSIIRVQTDSGLKAGQVYAQTENGIKLGIVYVQTENGLKQSS